jgi:hypothetical protein
MSCDYDLFILACISLLWIWSCLWLNNARLIWRAKNSDIYEAYLRERILNDANKRERDKAVHKLNLISEKLYDIRNTTQLASGQSKKQEN